MQAALATLVAAAVAACSPYSQTTRIVEGREVRGRPIASDAYAAYLQGATLEAGGNPKAAHDWFVHALDADPDSPEIQTAIARTACQFDPAQAQLEFERAVDLDPTYAPAHEAWARCALRAGRKEAALRHARRALLWAPFERQSTRLLSEVLQSMGKHAEARRLLTAFHAATGDSLRPSRDLTETVPQLETRKAAASAIREALREGDDERAEELALGHGFGRIDLGHLALLEARPDVALKQGQLVWFAEPANSDARVLVLYAATLLQDARAYRASLRFATPELQVPSKASAQALEHLLRTQVGNAAAEAFRDAYHRTIDPANERPQSEPRTSPALPHEVYRSETQGAAPTPAHPPPQPVEEGRHGEE